MGHRFPGKVRTRLISIAVCLFVVLGFVSPLSVCIVSASGKMVHVGYYEPNYINSLRNKYYPVSISSRALSDAEKTWLSEHSEFRIGYLNYYLL